MKLLSKKIKWIGLAIGVILVLAAVMFARKGPGSSDFSGANSPPNEADKLVEQWLDEERGLAPIPDNVDRKDSAIVRNHAKTLFKEFGFDLLPGIGLFWPVENDSKIHSILIQYETDMSDLSAIYARMYDRNLKDDTFEFLDSGYLSDVAHLFDS